MKVGTGAGALNWLILGPGELKLTQLNLDCLSRKTLRHLHSAALHTFAEHNAEMPGMFLSERPASQGVTPGV